MHLGDGIFIFILALVLLGPKKTSELANQLGKLMGEFRKASNDFKFQFNEEMRVSEQQERQKKQDAERAALAADPVAALPSPENTILPPSIENDPTNAASPDAVPYAISAVSATTGDEQPVDDHPLLRVDVIPPMDGSPADQTSGVEITPAENAQGAKQAEPQQAVLTREEDDAPVHHG